MLSFKIKKIQTLALLRSWSKSVIVCRKSWKATRTCRPPTRTSSTACRLRVLLVRKGFGTGFVGEDLVWREKFLDENLKLRRGFRERICEAVVWWD